MYEMFQEGDNSFAFCLLLRLSLKLANHEVGLETKIKNLMKKNEAENKVLSSFND